MSDSKKELTGSRVTRPRIGKRIVRGLRDVAAAAEASYEEAGVGDGDWTGAKADEVNAAFDYLWALCAWHEDKR